jgi:hypothetical protein
MGTLEGNLACDSARFLGAAEFVSGVAKSVEDLN